MSQKITELWVWVVTDADGDECVPRLTSRDGGQPMIASSRERLELFADEAHRIAREMGMPVKAVCFTRKMERP